MKILVAFYSKTGNTAKVALKIKEFFEEKKSQVEMLAITPAKEMTPKEMSKLEEIKLKNQMPSLAQYDAVFLGSPVWGFNATPVAVSFLKKIENAKGKKFVLFLSCHGFTGRSIKKMSGILAEKGAIVADFFAIKSLFALDEKKLAKTKYFCEKAFVKLSKAD